MTDETFALRDGHYCVVSGKVFGPWPNKGAATAGMQTEQRRVMKKSPRPQGGTRARANPNTLD